MSSHPFLNCDIIMKHPLAISTITGIRHPTCLLFYVMLQSLTSISWPWPRVTTLATRGSRSTGSNTSTAALLRRMRVQDEHVPVSNDLEISPLPLSVSPSCLFIALLRNLILYYSQFFCEIMNLTTKWWLISVCILHVMHRWWHFSLQPHFTHAALNSISDVTESIYIIYIFYAVYLFRFTAAPHKIN